MREDLIMVTKIIKGGNSREIDTHLCRMKAGFFVI